MANLQNTVIEAIVDLFLKIESVTYVLIISNIYIVNSLYDLHKPVWFSQISTVNERAYYGNQSSPTSPS